MKKMLFAVIAALILLLAACASPAPAAENIDAPDSATQVAELVNQNLTQSAPTEAAAASTPASTLALNSDYENAVSIEMQLLLGTFELEGTENAVTKEQAALLLPLWTNFKTLSESMMPARGEPGQQDQAQPNSTPQAPAVDTEAQAKIDELSQQIQAVMTPAQIQAISAMKLTQEAAMAIMEEQGIILGGPQQGGGNNAGGGQPPEGNGPGGDMAGGQPPADGQQPRGGEMGRAMFVSPDLLEALLELLSGKTS